MTPILTPPVRGEWAVMNPPGHPVNAFDLLAVDRLGVPYPAFRLWGHVFGQLDASRTYAWEQPALAPCNGVVSACFDAALDRTKLSLPLDLIALGKSAPPPNATFSWYGGNHVIIDGGGFFVLLAHLREGACRVRVGDQVRMGEELGKVGNSGQSIQPHLHIQAMSQPDPLPLFQNLISFAISACERRRGGRWETATDAPLTSGARYRFSDNSP